MCRRVDQRATRRASGLAGDHRPPGCVRSCPTEKATGPSTGRGGSSPGPAPDQGAVSAVTAPARSGQVDQDRLIRIGRCHPHRCHRSIPCPRCSKHRESGPSRAAACGGHPVYPPRRRPYRYAASDQTPEGHAGIAGTSRLSISGWNCSGRTSICGPPTKLSVGTPSTV